MAHLNVLCQERTVGQIGMAQQRIEQGSQLLSSVEMKLKWH
jgi:hypothetical protein